MLARFIVAWVIIIAVAAYENYITVHTAPALPDTEQNPICALLIGRDGAGLSTFVGLKTAGTALALLLSFILWQRPSLRRAVTVAVCCVAALQIGLFVYLTQDYRIERLRRLDRMMRVQSLDGAQEMVDGKLHPLLQIRQSPNPQRLEEVVGEPVAAPQLQVAPLAPAASGRMAFGVE